MLGVAVGLVGLSGLGSCGEPPVYSRLSNAMSGGGNGAAGGSIATGGVPSTGGAVHTGGLGTGGGSAPTGGAMTGGAMTGGAGPSTGGAATGGAATGGATGGAVATGGATPTGGVATGGTPGTGGSSGAVIDCASPTPPSGGLLSDLSAYDPTTYHWTSSNGLTGTYFVYHGGTGSTAAADVGFTSTTHNLHFTGSLPVGTYAGTGIVFDRCQSFSGASKLRFSFTGTNTCWLELQIQTFSQRPNTANPAGSCSPDGGTCGYNIVATKIWTPSNVATSPLTVPFTALANWSSTYVNQVVGVQWQITNQGGTPCSADLRLDDVQILP